MAIIKKYIEIISSINSKLGTIVSWFSGLLTRYLFDSSSAWLQELEWHFFSIIFLLGAAYTLQTDNHVRVDLFYSRFTERNKAFINFFGSLLFLLPFCILLIYTSKDFVLLSFKIGEVSPDPGGLPARYILKTVLPLSFLFLLLQSLSLLFKSFLTIKENLEK